MKTGSYIHILRCINTYFVMHQYIFCDESIHILRCTHTYVVMLNTRILVGERIKFYINWYFTRWFRCRICDKGSSVVVYDHQFECHTGGSVVIYDHQFECHKGGSVVVYYHHQFECDKGVSVVVYDYQFECDKGGSVAVYDHQFDIKVVKLSYMTINLT